MASNETEKKNKLADANVSTRDSDIFENVRRWVVLTFSNLSAT